MVIGITGGIGSGQSTVAQIFQQLGVAIVSADKLAREIMEPGRVGYQAVVKVFGKEYLTSDNRIDRKKLGALVFGNKRKLQLLNRTVHPILIERIKQEIEKLKKTNNFIGLEAAILFEAKMDSLVDYIVVVYAPRTERLKRIKQRDNLTRREIELRFKSQMPLREKMKLADFIIDNSKSLQETKKQVYSLWRELTCNQ
ncbi:MAG: dephospho-CoA kinase [bacterium]|nr:dephospho-CoA kinase [bacterium]